MGCASKYKMGYACSIMPRNTLECLLFQIGAFQTLFWKRSMEWLRQGGGQTYHVSACYLWNLASWDGEDDMALI